MIQLEILSLFLFNSGSNLYVYSDFSFLFFYFVIIIIFESLILIFYLSSALNCETNEHVAIKKISNAFDNKIDAKRTLREIKLLRHMDHENVSESFFSFLV